MFTFPRLCTQSAPAAPWAIAFLMMPLCWFAQGNVMVVGRKSQYSLYDEKIASFEDDGGLYDQKDSAGFIKLQALRLRTMGANRGL